MYEVFTFKTVMRRIPLSVKLIVEHSTILIVESERTIRLIHYIQRYFVVKNAQYILKESVSSKLLKSASKTYIQCKRPNTIS